VTVAVCEDDDQEIPPQKRSRYEGTVLGLRPLGFSTSVALQHAERTKWEQRQEEAQKRLEMARQSRQSVAAIIAAATAAATAAETRPDPSVTEKGASRSKHPKKHLSSAEKEAHKEKRLLKLVGAVVVKCMSKYQKEMDHDLFKKHAKEVCSVHTLAQHFRAQFFPFT